LLMTLSLRSQVKDDSFLFLPPPFAPATGNSGYSRRIQRGQGALRSPRRPSTKSLETYQV
jgi:hypothetical protein